MTLFVNGKVGKDGVLSCGKCGSIRTVADVTKDDDGELNWICVCCKRCDAILFYNGA
jgi:hypothetical protein